jgi:hypothetical protein
LTEARPAQGRYALYYAWSGMLESLLVFGFLLITPSDLENQWLLGFSKSRWLLLGVAAGVFLLHAALGRIARSDKNYFAKILSKFGRADFLVGLYFVLLVTPFVILPGIYFFFSLEPYIGVLLRLLPLLILFYIRIVQLFLTATARLVKDGAAINPARLLNRFLLVSWFALLLTNVSAFGLRHWFWNGYAYQQFALRYYQLFNFDVENNFPTWFSGILLLIGAIFALLIALHLRKKKEGYVRHWFGLAFIFLFLGADEVIKLHENLADPMGRLIDVSGPLGFYPWVFGAIPILLLLGWIYWKFILSLPRQPRSLIVLSAVIFVSGAIGFEIAGGFFLGNKAARLVLYTIEESLEMNGVILFIYSLSTYLQTMTLVRTYKSEAD